MTLSNSIDVRRTSRPTRAPRRTSCAAEARWMRNGSSEQAGRREVWLAA